LSKRITRKDVAKIAGVSVSAVSRVINNNGYVAKEKKVAIINALKETGYRQSRKAATTQENITKQLLFYNKDMRNEFTIEMYRGMLDYASRYDYMIVLSGTWDVKKIMTIAIDGVILPRPYNPVIDEYIALMGSKMSLPTVCASYGNAKKRPKNIPIIDADSYAAMEILIDYLFDKGHSNIALATPSTDAEEDPRISAYRNKLLPMFGKSIDKYIFTHCNESNHIGFDEENFFVYGEQIARQMHESKCDATAVACFNDNLAIGMINCFHKLGLRVPEDISVAGIDGLNIGNYVYPRLTSVSMSPFIQGSECVRVLLDLINGKKVKARTNIPLRIVEGDSVKILK